MNAPFKLILNVRDRLYKSGVFKTHRLNHPVISIGNLTLGGTGKTPLTIYLAGKMREQGFKPVILSRGYRRTTRGTVIVSRGDGPLTSWKESGDEPFLMAQRLAGQASVVVGESRYLAGLAAERERLGNLFLLDDGFQHRQLHRDVDIVTIDPDEWFRGEALLPAGRWREPKRALLRAHAACVQNGGGLNLPIPEFRVDLVVYGIHPAVDLRDKTISAFAGIAKPERFFDKLETMGLKITQKVPFPDHHVFSDADLAKLTGDVRITTEKDAVRLEGRGDFCTLRVSATIAEFDRLQELIFQRLSGTQCT
jgi:tetraacyldisaccharide 4'-kinase